MNRADWIDAFTRRRLDLDDRLSGTDWDEIALDLLNQNRLIDLAPRVAAERYVRQTER